MVFLHYDKTKSTILCDQCVRPRPSRYPKLSNPYVYAQGNLLTQRLGELCQGFCSRVFPSAETFQLSFYSGASSLKVKQKTHNFPSAGSSPALPTLLSSPCADWMLNSYSKHAELTEQDIKDYFDNKERVVNSMVE